MMAVSEKPGLDRQVFPLPDKVQECFQSLRVIQRRPLPAKPLQRIVVRATNWIGDTILTFPALWGLWRRFPQAHITVLAVPRVAPLFQGHPALSEIWLYPPRLTTGRIYIWWRFLQELRRRRFELALLFPNSFEAALVTWAAGIPHRVGYDTDGRGVLLSTIVQGPDRLAHLHQVYRHLGLLCAFGGQIPSGFPLLYLQEAEVAQAQKILALQGVEPRQPVIGISPGATYGTAKQWYPERFAAVADCLQSEFNVHVVLLGGPGEQETAGRIAAHMRRAPVNLVGRTDLRTALAVITQLRLLITNDSGLMHAAAALGVPLVALFGSTDPDTTAPFTPLATLIRHPFPCSPCLQRECPTDHCCMACITVEEVVAAAQGWLRRIG